MKTVLKTLLALIVCASPAVAQQQQWGQDNCLYTATARGWQKGRVCRRLVQGNPNVFEVYDSLSRRQATILTVDMRYVSTQAWVYAHNPRPSFDFRYVYRGTWAPSAYPSDYNVLIGGVWIIVVPPPQQGAPTLSPEAKASQQQAAQLIGQMQFSQFLKTARPDRGKPNCTQISGDDCYSRY